MSRVYAGNFIYASDANAPAPVNNNGVNAQSVTAGTDTTTSATFVDLAGTGAQISYSWTKYYDDTAVLALMEMGWNATVGTTQIQFAVQINSIDYTIGQGILASGGQENGNAGYRILTGIAAGTYTVKGRWRRSSGAGTANRDINTFFSLATLEVG